jgi:hypothetical protein
MFQLILNIRGQGWMSRDEELKKRDQLSRTTISPRLVSTQMVVLLTVAIHTATLHIIAQSVRWCVLSII